MNRTGVHEKRSSARRAFAAVAMCFALALLPPGLARAASLFLQVDTPAVTLTPASGDYARDYVEVTGASGIQLRIKTNDPVGMSILVRCPDPAPQIALNDFLVRTLTPPGNGGSALSTYTPIQATNLSLWSTGNMLAPFFVVSTDVRVRNLIGYNASPTAGTTAYTNSLVFTVVSP